jgi:hypothetical protein
MAVKFIDTYIGEARVFRRAGTCHVFPRNEATVDAVRQLEWAHQKLDEPCVTFQNGRSSHECAGEVIDQFEDVLLDHLHLVAA